MEMKNPLILYVPIGYRRRIQVLYVLVDEIIWYLGMKMKMQLPKKQITKTNEVKMQKAAVLKWNKT